MKTLAWLIVIGALGGIGYYLWRLRLGWLERQRTAEQRLSSLVVAAQAPAAAAPAPKADVVGIAAQQSLFESASKAAEAGEPALSIQIYARLLSRFPASAFAVQARAAVEAQKKKLSPP
ncbi:MAG TPA: hypothetical protein VF943_08365 [Burkholderiales bacterium]